MGVLSCTEHRSRRDQKRHEFTHLPANLWVESLDLSGSQSLRKLPEGITVKNRLNVSDCDHLTELPAHLHCHELEARNTPLTRLLEGLQVDYRLDLSGCTQLRELPPI